MVSLTHRFPPLTGNDTEDIAHWLAVLAGIFAPQEVALIRESCAFAAPLYKGQTDLTGMPLLQHALGSASILIDLGMDHETLAAALLHAVPEHLADWRNTLHERFGSSVTALVEGVSKMEQIRQFSDIPASGTQENVEQVESLRRMLLAMVEDIRVVLIKLAERTQTLRNLAQADEGLRRRIALETQNIFAPRCVADQMGDGRPVDALPRARTVQKGRAPARRKAGGSRTLHCGGHRHTATGIDQCRHPGGSERPPKAHLQHHQQDAAQAARLRPAL